MHPLAPLRLGCLLLAILAGFWAGPAHAGEPPSLPPLNEKDLFPYKSKGHGSLAGQAFLGSPSGKAITQAGVPIHLIPITPYTKAWFERSLRTATCGAKPDAPADGATGSRPPIDCARESLGQLLTDKRLVSSLRTTRANPTGHFWFTKLPAGRYYLVSLIEGGAGSHQEERAVGVAWLVIELDAGEKATNLVLTDCKNGLC